ncbi:MULTISPECIES: ribonuclease P protein component [unclassified Arenibacter]|uniref:ribonuclease P protein component n=1 Tax=unclassified Arenibacter TaxID=2615047 RepID=UPI002694CB5D|nr:MULTISPECIES: ribonuclease P protein component [unclassified Arenibacter]
MKNKIIPYNPLLKEFARQLRKNSTLAEVLLWQKIKQSGLGVEFHRQVPLLDFIVDFYCYEIGLIIEIDGSLHDYKYDQDAKGQGLLETYGVEFIRFTDSEIKENISGVMIALEKKVKEYTKAKNLSSTNKIKPNTVLLREGPSKKQKTTPLIPIATGTSGDNSIKVHNDFNFPKKEKLKSKKLIEQLFAEGIAITHYPLKLVYLKTSFEDGSKCKIGVTASKRNFKSAVKRNRIKRLMRESYRLNKHLIFNNIEDNFAFMFLYLGKEMPSQSKITDTMIPLMRKFVDKIAKGNK